jgi:AhpC/TSA family
MFHAHHLHLNGAPMKIKRLIAGIVLPLFLYTFSGIASALEVGDKAPDFDLTSTKGGKFKLSDLAGKKHVIIEFYVLDFTPT